MLRRIFEPPFSDLVRLPLVLVLRDVDSRVEPRRERSGADAAVVAVDFGDVETGETGAGSGIKSSFSRAIFSSTWISPNSGGGDCGWWWNPDSGGITGVDAVADGTDEVDGKELEERRDISSGVDADVDGATAPRDISSPMGKGEIGGCDPWVFGGGGACDCSMEAGLEGGE